MGIEGGGGAGDGRAIHVARTPGILATRYTGLKYAQAAALNFLFDQHQLFFKKSTQRRLVKPCKDAAGREDDLVTV